MAQLETARLMLRKEATTEPSVEQLRKDYEAYVTGFDEPDFPFEAYQEERTFLTLRAKRDSRFGYYNIFLKGEEQMIGWCNLGPCFCQPEIGALIHPVQERNNRYSSFEVEIGWAVFQSFRGRGYASEAAAALARYAFETFHVPRIVAFTDSDNTASIRVMEKLGMRLMIHSAENGTIIVGVIENVAAIC